MLQQIIFKGEINMAYFNGERIENAILKGISGKDIRFKNFSGKQTDYNPEGKRTFSILLTDEEAEELASKGWRIKMLENRNL